MLMGLIGLDSMRSGEAYHEETSNYSTNSVCRIYSTNDVGARIVVIGDPVFGILESVED
jgi:hypothetical protein